MSELARERIDFIETLHQLFLIKKGYGAFAYVSVKDTLILFDQYQASKESADIFIQQYMRKI